MYDKSASSASAPAKRTFEPKPSTSSGNSSDLSQTNIEEIIFKSGDFPQTKIQIKDKALHNSIRFFLKMFFKNADDLPYHEWTKEPNYAHLFFAMLKLPLNSEWSLHVHLRREMTDYKIAHLSPDLPLHWFWVSDVSKNFVSYPVVDRRSSTSPQKFCLDTSEFLKNYFQAEKRRASTKFCKAKKNKGVTDEKLKEVTKLEELPFCHYVLPEKKEIHMEFLKDNNNTIIPFKRTENDKGK
eukprot:GHVP01058606.1.p1 GENE.GHVP01058606.1~~GHVP01058606.1.p1  ORF type:complete len:249 (-),score=42.51 GHVP01058606.1:778-1497(-)